MDDDQESQICAERFVARDNFVLVAARKLASLYKTADEALLAEVLVELDAFSYDMSKAVVRTETVRRECESYDRAQAGSLMRIEETQRQIDVLREQLAEAKLVRAQVEEYRAIQAVIDHLPTRATTMALIDREAAEIAELERINADLTRQQETRAKDFALFFNALNALRVGQGEPIDDDEEAPADHAMVDS
ncbi:unnamed protein product (mitochondrion) [Plasmodiophora brassicae]|uniref:THO complex subunit 7 homolog n=1 Tax=Plasmodiophora brassicae TaxID=37360 RepID=A0A3P3YFK0_PLABS|nr:unnamed protein product [Plasmodiophora brassicae]